MSQKTIDDIIGMLDRTMYLLFRFLQQSGSIFSRRDRTGGVKAFADVEKARIERTYAEVMV